MPTFKAVADCAVLVEFATVFSEAENAKVIALDRAISASPLAGLCEVVPAMVNALVIFDPMVTDHVAVEAAIRGLFPLEASASNAITRHEIEVCYEPGYDRDLDAIATQTKLTREAVIAAHLSGEYSASMYGFAPGYAYLSGVPAAIQIPRKTAPVRDIPVGAVMIAGGQCLLTTLQMPTGWSILGSTPNQIMRDDPENPFLFGVGDIVTFKRVGVEAMPYGPPYAQVSA